jgi:hypothetical protein
VGNCVLMYSMYGIRINTRTIGKNLFNFCLAARWQQVRPSPGDCSAGSKELGGGGGGDGDCSGVEACCHLWCDRGGLERAIVLLLLGALLIIFSTVGRAEGAWELKRLCHEINNFLKVLKIKSVLSV